MITVFFAALLMGAVFNWKTISTSDRETSKDEREKTEVQIDDNQSKNAVIEDNVKDELSGSIDSGVNRLKTTGEITIDSISDAKLVIDKNEENSIRFEGGTIDQFNGAIKDEEQVDSYDFVPDIDGVYRFEFANIPNSIYHSLFVYNSGYEEIASSTCIKNGSGISINLNANETYHVAVKQSIDAGSYDLLVGCQKEIVDISKCTSVTDAIQFTQQRNVYSFVADESRDIIFTFSNIPDYVGVNLYIYNSDYEELNYKTGIGNDSGVTITVSGGVLYYIVVEQNWNYGSYNLNIR